MIIPLFPIVTGCFSFKSFLATVKWNLINLPMAFQRIGLAGDMV